MILLGYDKLEYQYLFARCGQYQTKMYVISRGYYVKQKNQFIGFDGWTCYFL